MFKYKVISKGFYAGSRRRPGETIVTEEAFTPTPKWLELLETEEASADEVTTEAKPKPKRRGKKVAVAEGQEDAPGIPNGLADSASDLEVI
jgi:hypothetical protein